MADIYSPMIVRALELGATWHNGQMRRHPTEQIPYFSHPVGVGMLLQRTGYGDEVISAGILHDVIEDCGVTQEALALAMSPQIAQLVADVSEPSKTLAWDIRKAAYRNRLSAVSDEAVAIAAADHLHNMRSIIQIIEAGIEDWSPSVIPHAKRREHERGVFEIVQARLEGPLVESLGRALDEFDRLPLDQA